VTGLPVLADEALRGRRGMVTGANTDDVHLRGVDLARDVAVGRWGDFRAVTGGEPCVDCGQALTEVRAVEVGHIFKLGTKYTEALDVSVLGPDGTRVRPVMGCYGIGVERAMAAGMVEVTVRDGRRRSEVPADDAADCVRDLVRAALRRATGAADRSPA
jgi:prolyl-tRNA synthetase